LAQSDLGATKGNAAMTDHSSPIAIHHSPITDYRSPFTDHCSPITVHPIGLVDYETVWQRMRKFSLSRDADAADEIWCVEHPPVYTLGLASKPEHLPRIPNKIPVVQSDRGGQITYHGPGQAIVYPLLDLRRRGLGVRSLVRKLEFAVIKLLAVHGIKARGNDKAPGVYVGDAKIAALGLRIRNGCCYHGLSLNVDMDLSPFEAINPCGFPGLKLAQTRDLGIADTPTQLGQKLAEILVEEL
jgi:lipoyl(octanoyl) transferase